MMKPHWCLFLSWSKHYGHRLIPVAHVVMYCCPGFKRTDCTTRKKLLLCNYIKNPFLCVLKYNTDLTTLCLKAICTTPCEPGYNCTSPNECTPDTIIIGKLHVPQQFSLFCLSIIHISVFFIIFQALQTTPSVPVLRSMKVPMLLLGLVKVSVPLLNPVKVLIQVLNPVRALIQVLNPVRVLVQVLNPVRVLIQVLSQVK